jgi:hypothetical protein
MPMKTERNTSMDKSLPEIFDSKGAFVPWTDEQLASVSPEIRERYAAVADAFNACKAAERALKEAENLVVDTVKAVRFAETYTAEHWPPRSAIDCARDVIETQRLMRGR